MLISCKNIENQSAIFFRCRPWFPANVKKFVDKMGVFVILVIDMVILVIDRDQIDH